MGDDVGSWVEEFIQRRISSSTILKALVQAPAVAPKLNSSYIKTLILLMLIECCWSVSIEEFMLEIMEILEQCLRREGSPISTAFCGAYCAWALECTFKYLEVEASNPKYIEAIQRIWLGRVRNMRPSPDGEIRCLLFSNELKRLENNSVDSFEGNSSTRIDVF